MGALLAEQAVDSADFRLETTLTVSPGDWFYPLLLEPLGQDSKDPVPAQEEGGIVAQRLGSGSSGRSVT